MRRLSSTEGDSVVKVTNLSCFLIVIMDSWDNSKLLLEGHNWCGSFPPSTENNKTMCKLKIIGVNQLKCSVHSR